MTFDETIRLITSAELWDDRVALMRQVPQRHGTDEHAAIYAEIAQRLYVPHLAPDFAYVHESAFYELAYFQQAYDSAEAATDRFTKTDAEHLAKVLEADPVTLLAFRTIVGLTKTEFAAASALVSESLGLRPLSPGKVDSMEKRGSPTTTEQAQVAGSTIDRLMADSLFGDPGFGLKLKQRKPDTIGGWPTVAEFANEGVPYSVFLHQRHYGGAFRQLLDATSERRGNLIEDAVEKLFKVNGVPYIRTGSHNQAEIETRFEVAVRPTPDFVVFDDTDTLRGLLECKGANDGGTARDKALRFRTLREESVRLGGVPLLAVLGGLGWSRVNDTLGPVIRDCDGRVFTVANLPEMLTVQPFPALIGLTRH